MWKASRVDHCYFVNYSLKPMKLLKAKQLELCSAQELVEFGLVCNNQVALGTLNFQCSTSDTTDRAAAYEISNIV